MNNNFLENWMSLKWFSLNQLLSYEWANHEIIYIISLLPIAYLITKYLNKKITYQVSIPKNKLINIRYSLMRFIPNLLFTISIILIILSLARPQKSNEKVDRWSEGIDIMLVIDISESMQIEDFSPNRFEASKDLAKEFVKDRKNDRVGLVIFEGESYTQCPLTSDRDVLVELIESTEQGIVEQGTAIGMGLATAINRLRESEAPSKVIILLTDGVNTHGKIHPLNATEIAKEFNIRVYTIGVGTNGKAKTPVAIDPFSGKYIYDLVDVEIDEKTLKTIALETGGKYFRATDNNKLKEVYKEINELEKAKIKTIEYDIDLPEKANVFIVLGLVFLLLEFFISKYFIPSIS